jgi:iron-sulfur cluster assembly protein
MIITVTDQAVQQIKKLLSSSEYSIGIRIGVKSGGCSGFKYYIEYAKSKLEMEDEVNQQGVKIIIDPKAVLYLIGSEMDYVDEKFKAGFVFKNPNEKSQCGCGESFN